MAAVKRKRRGARDAHPPKAKKSTKPKAQSTKARSPSERIARLVAQLPPHTGPTHDLQHHLDAANEILREQEALKGPRERFGDEERRLFERLAGLPEGHLWGRLPMSNLHGIPAGELGLHDVYRVLEAFRHVVHAARTIVTPPSTADLYIANKLVSALLDAAGQSQRGRFLRLLQRSARLVELGDEIDRVAQDFTLRAPDIAPEFERLSYDDVVRELQEVARIRHRGDQRGAAAAARLSVSVRAFGIDINVEQAKASYETWQQTLGDSRV